MKQLALESAKTKFYQGQKEAAHKELQQIVKDDPQNIDAQCMLALSFSEQNLEQKALEHYNIALEIDSNFYPAYFNRGNIYFQKREYEKAKEEFNSCIKSAPNYAPGHYNLANTLGELSEFSDCILSLKRAIALEPTFVQAYLKLGDLYFDMGKFEECFPYYKRLFSQNFPGKNTTIEAFENKLVEACHEAFLAQDSHKEKELFYGALELLPDSVHIKRNIIYYFFYHERFREGFRFYLYRKSKETMGLNSDLFNPQEFPKDLSEKNILLLSEQGLGDQILFLRFLPLLKLRKAKITCLVDPKLYPILKESPELERVLIPEDIQNSLGSPEDYDYRLFIGDLPYCFDTQSPEDIPLPYPLKVNPELRKEVLEQLQSLGPGPYMGLTWRSGAQEEDLVNPKIVNENKGYFTKAIPLEDLSYVLDPIKENTQLISLQRLPKDGEREKLSKLLSKEVHDFSNYNDDLEKMLALLDILDSYVGVSNTNTHLRASVDKSCHVYVPYPWDWRWVSIKRRSLWYPNFSYYLQEPDGSYKQALERLRTDLTSLFFTTESTKKKKE